MTTYNYESQIKEFTDAINSEEYSYARKCRASQYSEIYSVMVYSKKRMGMASLPLEIALEVLERNGKEKPYSSIV